MANTVTIEAKTVQAILSELKSLRADVQTIKKKLLEKEPSYGSDEWWEASDKEALKELRAGKGIKFSSAEEAIKWLKS